MCLFLFCPKEYKTRHLIAMSILQSFTSTLKHIQFDGYYTPRHLVALGLPVSPKNILF